MSVLIETSLGDLVVDLDVDNCPKTCENFIKLSKLYRYNYLTFYSVQKNFIAQSGDPSNSGQGGQSIWSLLDPSSPSYTQETHFTPERKETLRHNVRGTLSMACKKLRDKNDEQQIVAGSQFFVTLKDDLDQLDEQHAPFGRIVEGQEKDGVLDKLNAAFVNEKDKRPLRDIRIHHVIVLDDPFDDPAGLSLPSRTPSPTPEQLAPIGLDASAPLNEEEERAEEEVEEERRKRDTNAAALTLEMVGDLPFAEVRPPENILFVCKLNPVTQSEDLELIFSRFGTILHCEVIRDKRTGDSLQYAFIEFDEQQSAEQAYFKMQNVLVDDRRIWVDFSQSVSKLSGRWNTSRAGGKPLREVAHASQKHRDDRHRYMFTHEPSSNQRATDERRRDRMGVHRSYDDRREREAERGFQRANRYDSRESERRDERRRSEYGSRREESSRYPSKDSRERHEDRDRRYEDRRRDRYRERSPAERSRKEYR